MSNYKNIYEMPGEAEVSVNRSKLKWSEKKCKIIKTCVECGQEFESPTSANLYCTAQCRRTAELRRHREEGNVYRKKDGGLTYERSNKDWWLRKRYGITIDIYNEMKKNQKDVCAICGQPPTKGKGNNYKLQVDHDHKSGEIRGLLCTGCNAGLGCFKDKPSLLQVAIRYLQTNGVKTVDKLENNPVDRPLHYTTHQSGIEAIQIIENLLGNTANSIKYLMRLDKKWDSLEDAKKSDWYVMREIWRRSGLTKDQLEFPSLNSVKSSFDVDFKSLSDYNLGVPFQQVNDIKKVVECSSGNVKAAILYIWLADKQPGIKNLLIASAYIKQEIEQRSKQETK